MDEKCRYCFERIVRRGDGWTHQPAGAAFQDGQHEYCHRTVATPEPKACPHATPFVYCDGCVANPCPIGLGEKEGAGR